MRNLNKKIRNAGLILCFALIASLAMEGSLEAQKRGRGGGGGGKSSMRRGGGGGGGMRRGGGGQRQQMNRGGGQRRQMNRGGNSNRNRNRGGMQRRGQQQQRRKMQNSGHKGHAHKGHKGHKGHHAHKGHKHGHKHRHGHKHHHWKHHQKKYHVGRRHRHGYKWRYDYCHQVRHNRHLCWSYTKWCGYYPERCYWWYNYCGPKYYFDPSFCVSYDWNYCPVYVNNTVTCHWYLGLNCVYIPGLGYGIQDVYEGSPAAAAGLQQGMIIKSANGSQLNSEGVLNGIMSNSNGQMAFDVVADQGGQSQSFDVSMVRVNK